MSPRIRKWYIFAALALFGACEGGTGPVDDVPLMLAVAVPGQAATAAPGPARAVTMEDGSGNMLVLTRVALVLREVELERVDGQDCAEGPEDDECEEFEAGPMLLELPLDDAIDHVVGIDVPAGSYDEIEFDIHKAEGGGDDAAFVAAHPDFEGVSIRVEGTWNGEAFVFLQDLDEEQEIDLSPPLVIEEGAAGTTVTLRVDVNRWFVAPGGSLIDPRTANKGQPNEGIVENNIKQSIEAFEDDDEDGQRDD